MSKLFRVVNSVDEIIWLNLDRIVCMREGISYIVVLDTGFKEFFNKDEFFRIISVLQGD